MTSLKYKLFEGVLRLLKKRDEIFEDLESFKASLF